MAASSITLTMRLRSRWALYAAYFVRRPRWAHDRLVRRAIAVTTTEV